MWCVCREAMLEVEVVSEVVQSCKDQLKECSVQETQLKHRIVSKEEKISKLTLQHNNKMTAAADTLSHLQQSVSLSLPPSLPISILPQFFDTQLIFTDYLIVLSEFLNSGPV